MTGKEMIPQFFLGFLQGARALVNAARSINGDPVGAGGADIEDIVHGKKQFLFGQTELEPAGGRNRGNTALFQNVFQTLYNASGIIGIVFDQKIQRFHLVAEGGDRHFRVGSGEDHEGAGIQRPDPGGQFNPV